MDRNYTMWRAGGWFNLLTKLLGLMVGEWGYSVTNQTVDFVDHLTG